MKRDRAWWEFETAPVTEKVRVRRPAAPVLNFSSSLCFEFISSFGFRVSGFGF